MLSIVCVYNDGEMLERRLLASLRAQSAAHDFVGVDNRSSEFDGAAKALNWGARRARGEFVVFAHQDVALLTPDWLARAEEALGGAGDFGWAGIAGCARDGRYRGILRDRAAVWGETFDGLLEVQTLDECLLATRRRDAGDFFDEGVPGWHAYGVEACCAALRRGLRNYVLPLPVWHDSRETNVAGLEAAYAYVWRKHGDALGRVHTMCGTLPDQYGWEGSRWKGVPRRLGERLAAARYELAGHRRALRQGFLETLEEMTAGADALAVLHAPAPFARLDADSILTRPARRRRVAHHFAGWGPGALESDEIVVSTDLARTVGEHWDDLRDLRARARRLWLCANLEDVPVGSAAWKRLRRHSAEVRLTRRYDGTAVSVFEIGAL